MDSQSFLETWCSVEKQLYRRAFWNLKSRYDAQDAVQEVFLHAYQARERVVDSDHLTRYLNATMRNHLTDRYRRRKNQQQLGYPDGAYEPDLDHVILVKEAIRLIDYLPIEEQSAITDFVTRDGTLIEASRTSGVPASTIRSRERHALRSLRKLVQQKRGNGLKGS